MPLEYIKYRQEQLEKKRRREAKLEAEKEAERVARMEAKAREQEEIVARKRLLIEQQEAERLHQKRVQIEEEMLSQKWSKQLDTLLADVDHLREEDNRLEEIRVIIRNREPSLQQLDWATWLSSDPLNQRLADLDFDRAIEMFNRDNLMAKRRKKGRSKKKHVPYVSPYVLAFSGDTGASAADDYATTDFNPDDYNLNLGCTVSYWVRPDAVGGLMFAFGRKHSNNQRFCFGINQAYSIFIGLGGNRMRSSWESMGVDTSQLEYDGSDWILKTDGTWYHFAVTYADRESTSEGKVDRKVYINGELSQEAKINWSSTGGGTQGMMFGGRRVGGTGYNNGWACALSQVGIFDTAKDADWVTNVYNTDREKLNLSGQSGLVGYWKFNKGSGTTITDYSGNGNHGTFAPISGDTTAYPTWEKVN